MVLIQSHFSPSLPPPFLVGSAFLSIPAFPELKSFGLSCLLVSQKKIPTHQSFHILLLSKLSLHELDVQLFPRTMYFFPESRVFRAILISSTFLITILLSVYIATWLLFMFQRRLQGPVKVPPTVPYVIPFIGSAISFAIDPRKFISASR